MIREMAKSEQETLRHWVLVNFPDFDNNDNNNNSYINNNKNNNNNNWGWNNNGFFLQQGRQRKREGKEEIAIDMEREETEKIGKKKGGVRGWERIKWWMIIIFIIFQIFFPFRHFFYNNSYHDVHWTEEVLFYFYFLLCFNQTSNMNLFVRVTDILGT